MTNELAVYTNTLDDLQRTAKLLAASQYFDGKGDNNQAIAKCATALMAGREMGYGPFASVSGIHVIHGKPTISANLMASAVKAHPKYDYRVRKMAADEVVIEFFENGESIGESTFSADEARAAKTQNMDKFPRNMLFARAISNGVKWFCPDVFNGNIVYVPEEMGDDGEPDSLYTVIDGATGEVLEESDSVYDSDPPLPTVYQNVTEPAQSELNDDVNFATHDTTVTPENGVNQPTDDAELLQQRRGKLIGKINGWFGGFDVKVARPWLMRVAWPEYPESMSDWSVEMCDAGIDWIEENKKQINKYRAQFEAHLSMANQPDAGMRVPA